MFTFSVRNILIVAWGYPIDKLHSYFIRHKLCKGTHCPLVFSSVSMIGKNTWIRLNMNSYMYYVMIKSSGRAWHRLREEHVWTSFYCWLSCLIKKLHVQLWKVKGKRGNIGVKMIFFHQLWGSMYMYSTCMVTFEILINSWEKKPGFLHSCGYEGSDLADQMHNWIV